MKSAYVVTAHNEKTVYLSQRQIALDYSIAIGTLNGYLRSGRNGHYKRKGIEIERCRFVGNKKRGKAIEPRY